MWVRRALHYGSERLSGLGSIIIITKIIIVLDNNKQRSSLLKCDFY